MPETEICYAIAESEDRLTLTIMTGAGRIETITLDQPMQWDNGYTGRLPGARIIALTKGRRAAATMKYQPQEIIR